MDKFRDVTVYTVHREVKAIIGDRMEFFSTLGTDNSQLAPVKGTSKAVLLQDTVEVFNAPVIPLCSSDGVEACCEYVVFDPVFDKAFRALHQEIRALDARNDTLTRENTKMFIALRHLTKLSFWRAFRSLLALRKTNFLKEL